MKFNREKLQVLEKKKDELVRLRKEYNNVLSRILRIIEDDELVKLGDEVFDDKLIFLDRLDTQSLALGNKSPIDLIVDGEIQPVKEEIIRIKYNVYG